MSSRDRKTDAIILKSADVFDADRSYLLFTQEFGKVWARARGVRKTTSRLTGHLLAYVPTTLELVEAGTNYLIVQAQTGGGEAERYPRHTLLFLRHAEIVSEAVDKLFVEREPHAELYDGIVYTIDRLHAISDEAEPNESKARLVVAELLFKMLAVLGYHPELERCAVTGEVLEERWVGWSSVLGGVISEAAQNSARFPVRRLKYPRSIVLLRQFARSQFMAERVGVDSDVLNEAASLIFDYVQTQVGKPLKSIRFDA
jgi:DNA repair protein RecO (recombination protein O)